MANTERGREIFSRVADGIKPGMSSERIFQVLIDQPEIKKKSEDAGEDPFRALAETIAESEDKTAGAVFDIAAKLFKAEEQNQRKLDQLQGIRRQIEEHKEAGRIRENL